LTITNAGSPSSPGRGITLYAKVAGGWTGRINKLAKQSVETDDEKYQGEQTGLPTGADDFDCIPVQILIDGPYGGLKLDLAGYQNVLLVAGGSGITFALGCIEESLRRVQEGGQEGRLEWIHAVWVVRDFRECNPGHLKPKHHINVIHESASP
jgi:ferric-chelate reductase